MDGYLDDYFEAYWINKINAYTLRTEFNYMPEGKENSTNRVLFCLVPNHELFIDAPEESKGKFVYAKFLLDEGIAHKFDVNSDDPDESAFDTGSKAKEIGERIYFDRPFLVTPRDIQSEDEGYGVGLGKRMLTESQNVNQIKRDVLKTSAYYGNPAKSMPHDLFVQQSLGHFNIEPGVIIPSSASGEETKFLVPVVDYKAHVGLLEYEVQKLREDLPFGQDINQKRARQSQMEVNLLQQTSDKMKFIYKLMYLMYGVSKHLAVMFDIAKEQGVFTKPPSGLSIDDFRPSISNLISSEFRKAEAMNIVRGIGMIRPLVEMDRSVSDNIDTNYCARQIMTSLSASKALLSKSKVKEIRDIRKQEIEKQRQEQQGVMDQNLQNDTGLKTAQSEKALAETALLRQQLGGA